MEISNQMQVIYIFGFPHCGTSILKSIIGHIPDVQEVIEEIKAPGLFPKVESDKKFLLGKTPYFDPKMITNKKWFKIFIVRNPIFVFSSLNKRFSYKLNHTHSIKTYLDTLSKFDFYQQNPQENLFLIKYEDLFLNGFDNFKKILSDMGLNYTDEIFDNTSYTNRIFKDTNIEKILENKPKNINHKHYRSWQINQEFQNLNDPNSIDLLPVQMELLLSNELVMKYWGDEINQLNLL
jgi:hypothetical protein